MTNDLHERPFGLMEDVFVDPGHRGSEIGTTLVKCVVAEAKRHRCYKLIATSRHARNRVTRSMTDSVSKTTGESFGSTFHKHGGPPDGAGSTEGEVVAGKHKNRDARQHQKNRGRLRHPAQCANTRPGRLFVHRRGYGVTLRAQTKTRHNGTSSVGRRRRRRMSRNRPMRSHRAGHGRRSMARA